MNSKYPLNDTINITAGEGRINNQCNTEAITPQIRNEVQTPVQSFMNVMPQQTAVPGFQNGTQSLTFNAPETVTNPYFWPAYLSKFIGYWVHISSFVGNSVMDYTGRLVDVGAAYVSIRPLMPDMLVVIDMFSIKVVQIILTTDPQRLLDISNS